MKISFFEVKSWEKQYLKKALSKHTLYFFEEPLNDKNIDKAKKSDIVSVFIYSNITKKVITSLKKTKLICTRSTGFDHIDLKACSKHNVCVCNVPSYGDNTVAEHTFALILSLSRKIHKSYTKTLNNDFSLEGLKGFDLKNKTLGVLGTGKIGLHVVRIARGFGMKVLAHDLNPDEFMSEVLDFEYVGRDYLYKNSDIISLHLPHTKDTHHLINKKTFKKMKQGAILINTARGSLVELDALLEALDKEKLSGAGLDVIEGEEYIKEEKELLHSPKKSEEAVTLAKDHILFDKENVIFTPHIGFYSQEALDRILKISVNNILNFIKHKDNYNSIHE